MSALIAAAACLERQGEAARARPVVREAADILLAGNPHRELEVAATLLGTRSHFTSMRELLPLGRVAHFLEHAEFNQELRLDSYLQIGA